MPDFPLIFCAPPLPSLPPLSCLVRQLVGMYSNGSMPRFLFLVLMVLFLFDLVSSLPFGSEILPISDYANISLTSSLITMGESMSTKKIHHFALSVHDRTIFLGCSCIQSAFVYHRGNINDPWELQEKFFPLTAEETDFGVAVSISVNKFNRPLRLAFVGSPSYNNNTGAVYLYKENVLGDWSFVNILSVGSPGDRFGSSVFLDKFNQFAVGAPDCTSKGIGEDLSASLSLCLYLSLLMSPLSLSVVYVYEVQSDYSFVRNTILPLPFKPPTNGRLRGGCTLIGSDDIVNEALVVGVCPTFSSLGLFTFSLSLLTLAL
jgi:hypothetical protein